MKQMFLLTVLTYFGLNLYAGDTDAYCTKSEEGNTWKIGNAFLERTLNFDESFGFYTESFLNKATGVELIKKARESQKWVTEFSFVVGKYTVYSGYPFWGGPFDKGAFNLAGSSINDLTNGKQLQVTLTLQKNNLNLEVTLFYEVYNQHPAIRKWISIKNNGETGFVVKNLCFESVKFSFAPPSDCALSAFYGVFPRESFITGRVDDVCMVLKDVKSNSGALILNEASGYAKRIDFFDWSSENGNGVKVLYDTDLFPFEHFIEKQQEFTSAKSSIILFKEGSNLDPHWIMPNYTSDIIMRKGKGFKPVWVYNTWVPFMRKIDEKTCLELIPVASKLGIDVFTIDDGWQMKYGENSIETNLFPNGLDTIRALCEKNNMRLGLWIPFAAISTEAEDYLKHPEWACREDNGDVKMSGSMAGSVVVMCMATPYRENTANRISSLIKRYNLKYVKLDLTTIFNAYGESPGCAAQGHDHHNWQQSLNLIYNGIKYVCDKVSRENPEVLLDITFELWGQKHLIDYALIATGDLDWLSNVDDGDIDSPGTIQARTLLYQRSLAIPTETMLIGNLQAQTPSKEDHFATAIASCPLFCGDLRKIAPSDLEWFHKQVSWYKNLRNNVPFNESFFTFGSWLQPNKTKWDGYARLSKKGEGIISIFRNESKVNEVTIKIPALPEGTYSVKSVFTPKKMAVYTAADFAKGVKIGLNPGMNAEVFEVGNATK